MKKLFKVFAVLLLALCCLTGCADNSTTNDSATDDAIKIGVSIWGNTDNQGALCCKYLDYAAKALGIELVYGFHDSETDAVVNSIQSLIQAGCKGIILCNYTDGELVSSMDLCEEAGVYLTQFFRTINDADMKAYVESKEFYAGRVHEDEYDDGYGLGKIMADKGCKNVVMISYNHGDPSAETRATGYRDAFKEAGINLLAEQWEVRDAETASSVMENFMNIYPELDGVAITGVTESLGGVMSSIEAADRAGDFVVVSTDFIVGLEDYMNKGLVSAMAGGHEMDPVYSLLVCYNTITGGFGEVDGFVDLMYPYVKVTDTTEVADYFKYFEGDIPALDADEIKALTKTYNPDFKLADMEAAIAKMSVADAIERHAKYFN